MRKPVSSSSRSFVAPRITDRPTRAKALLALLRFGLGVAVLSVAFSALALPWVDLPWWKVTRRCVSVAAAVTLWWCIKVVERRSFRSYGLVPFREGKRHLRFGLLLGLSSLGVMAAIGLATNVCSPSVSPDQAKLWRTVLGFVPAAGLISVLEELVFRGYLLHHLLTFSKPLAVIASSALYSVVHLRSPALTWMTAMELGGLFLLGAVLALSVLQTRQLSLAIGLHASLAYGARVNKVLITFHDSSNWLAGTSRLVNGAAGWMALLAIAGIVSGWSRVSGRGGVQDGDA